MKIQILMLLTAFSFLQAQSFEDYQKEQASAFKNYQDQMDVAFVSYLKSQWSHVHGKPPSELYQKKKPKQSPMKKEAVAENNEKLLIDAQKPVLLEPEHIVKKEPASLPKEVQSSKYEYKDISYYGLGLNIAVDKSLPTHLRAIKSSDDISQFWDKMSHYDFSETIKLLHQYETNYKLNGWSMYQVTARLSKSLYDQSYEHKLFSWFLLNKLGYRVKVGYTKSSVVLLSATEDQLYSTPFVTMNSRRYYALDYYPNRRIGALYTYKKDFPAAKKGIGFSLKTLPLLPYKAIEREVVFKDHDLDFTINLNQHLLEYMKAYLQVDYKIYFDAVQDSVFEDTIVKKLSALIADASEKEALDLLLHFVQKSFAYQTDDEQFGHEKVMFAMETFFYPYSDCDDRAVLFAYLSERLLGVKVVGLKFSDHMATAIHVKKVANDLDYLQIDSFIVADPTYINANLGYAMPKYLNKKAEIITTENTQRFISAKNQIIVKR